MSHPTIIEGPVRLHAIVALLCSTVAAQTQSQPDNATILNAIQALTSRVDNLQKDVDQLKRQRKPASTPAVGTKPTPTIKPPDASSIGGWLINVVPPTDDNISNSIAQFAGPLSDFNFSLHTKIVQGQQQFAYFGEGYFHAEENGHYVFIIDAAPVYAPGNVSPWQFNCEVRLTLAGNRIIDGATHYKTTYHSVDRNPNYSVQHQTFQAGVDIKPGNQKIIFKIGCFLNDTDRAEPLNMSFPFWQHNAVKILVRTPADSAPRAFTPDELYHHIVTR